MAGSVLVNIRIMSSEIKNLEISSDAEPGRDFAIWEIISVVSSGLLMEWVVLAFAGRSKLVGGVPVVLAFDRNAKFDTDQSGRIHEAPCRSAAL